MLLKFSSFLIPLVLICGVGTAASAQIAKIESLEFGEYVLKSGNKERCLNKFRLSNKDIKGKSLMIATHYGYEILASETQTPSDLDKNCVFKGKSTREDIGVQETILKNISQEICSGKLRSQIISMATISRGEILVKHQMNRSKPHQCLWKKQ